MMLRRLAWRRAARALDRATTAYLARQGTDTLTACLQTSDRALRDIALVAPGDQTAVGVIEQAALAHVHAFQWLGGARHAEQAAELLGILMEWALCAEARLAAQIDLATLELARYAADGNRQRLDHSVELYEDAIRQDIVSRRHRAILSGGLGSALVELSRLDARADLLDRAVRLHEEAVKDVPPDAPFRNALLVNWATALVTRWQRSGDAADLRQAGDVHEKVFRTTETDWQFAVPRAELLWERYAAEGENACLEQIVNLLKPIADTVPHEVPLWQTAATNLANAMLELRWRYAADDSLGTLLEQAALVIPPGTPAWARLRHADGVRHWQDYLTSGDLGRLAQALGAWHDAVRSVPEGDAIRAGLLNSVAVGTQQQAGHLAGTAAAASAADEAVDAARQAVDAAGPAAPQMAFAWNTLGHALGLRSRLRGRPADITEAVAAWRTAVGLSQAGSRGRASHLGSLASGLRERAAADRNADAKADLREAIALHHEAIGLMSESVELPGMLANLGRTLHGLAAETRDADAYAQARHAFKRAIDVGKELAPAQALDAAVAWRLLAFDGLVDWSDVADASDAALAMLWQVVRSQVFRADKETWLRSTVDVMASAALAHAALGDMAAAALAVEGGRGLLLAQVLPPVGLEQARPELFARFLSAALAVESMSFTVEPPAGSRSLRPLPP